MKRRLKTYSVSRWRKARRNKVKEECSVFLIAQIECTIRQGKKTRFRFSTFPRMKSVVEVGKTAWRESRGLHRGLQRPFSNKWHIACSRGESVNFKERSSPTKIEWTTQGRREEKKSSRTTRNVTERKQVTAKKLEPRSVGQTVVDDGRDSTVGISERRFTPYLSVSKSSFS